MIRSMILGIVMALACLSAPVAWSQDAALCKGIADVMRHQPAGFREIKGEPKESRFNSRLWLPGASDCWIDEDRGGQPVFNCSWPATSPVAIELEMRRYADYAASCFPGGRVAYSTDEIGLAGTFDIKGMHFLWLFSRTNKLIGLVIE